MSDFTAKMHRIRFLSGLRWGREGKGKGKEREMRGRRKVGNANPGGIFQTRVYGFGGLQTRVPGFDNIGLSIWHAAGTLVSADSQSWTWPINSYDATV